MLWNFCTREEREWGSVMDVNISRLKHSYAVATKMRESVLLSSKIYSCSANDMYVLGMLHDIGYGLDEEQKNHAHIGGEILREQGYKLWKEIYYHGIVQMEYMSQELRLLNHIDMTTGPDGEDMTIQERIDDIGLRYGKGSRQEKDAIKLAEEIKGL